MMKFTEKELRHFIKNEEFQYISECLSFMEHLTRRKLIELMDSKEFKNKIPQYLLDEISECR